MTKIITTLTALYCLWTGLFYVAWANDSLAPDYFQGEFDLRSFNLQLEDKIGRDVQCQTSEIQAGLEELPFLGTMDPPPGRQLIPSNYPLRRDAAWLIHPGGCPALLPEFNGLGLAALNRRTGEAQFYLGFFEKLEMNEDEWAALPTNSKMRQFNQPEIKLTNIILLSAQCTYRPQNFWDKVAALTWSRTRMDLDCTLTDGQGVVHLRRR